MWHDINVLLQKKTNLVDREMNRWLLKVAKTRTTAKPILQKKRKTATATDNKALVHEWKQEGYVKTLRDQRNEM